MSGERALDAADEDARWKLTTWEGAAAWRTGRVLEATPYARLRWLESALELAHRAGALPARGNTAGRDGLPADDPPTRPTLTEPRR